MKTLLPHLILDDTSLEPCRCEGDAGFSVSTHAVYHVVVLKMNRHVPHALLPTSIVALIVKAAVTNTPQLP